MREEITFECIKCGKISKEKNALCIKCQDLLPLNPMKEEMKIDGWEIWSRNWENAKRFFESKGNAKSRSKLKDKWFKNFRNDLESIDKQSYQKGLKKI